MEREGLFTRRVALPLFQVGLGVILGVSARNGDESSLEKIRSATEDYRSRGEPVVFGIRLAKMIAGNKGI